MKSNITILRLVAICITLAAFSTLLFGQAASPSGLPKPIAISKEALKNEADGILKRLLVYMDRPQPKVPWPPVLKSEESDATNVISMVKNDTATIVLMTGISLITEGIPDRLACIIAHELIHISRGHCSKPQLSGTNLLYSSYNRAGEEEADTLGFYLLLKAGYSYRKAVDTYNAFRRLGDQSPPDAQSTNHPSWTERLENIDKNQSGLWRSMSSFNTGITLLMGQNYEAAISCFDKVIREFPKCFEAMSNIGYARLMQYFDQLTKEDIIERNIGQIVPGGFYKKSAFLEDEVRSSPVEYWQQAIDKLRGALVLNPKLSLVNSYLGIAYFLDPYQTQASIGKSLECMTQALNLVEKDETLDSALKACVYLNAGAIELARKNYITAAKRISQGRASRGNRQNDQGKAFAGLDPVNFRHFSTLIDNALDYNQVLINFRKSKEVLTSADLDILENYLKKTDTSSIWWNPAYQIYETGSLSRKKPLLTKNQILISSSPLCQQVKSIVVDSFALFLSQDISEIITRFPNYKKLPEAESHNIYKYQFPQEGFEIIAGRKVLIIDINAPNSHAKLGSGTCPIKEVEIGVAWKTISSELKGLDYTQNTISNRSVLYYSSIGIGFALKNSNVSELIIF